MSTKWPQALQVEDKNFLVERPNTKEVWKLYIKYQNIIDQLSDAASNNSTNPIDVDGLVDIADDILTFAKIDLGDNNFRRVDLDYFDLGDNVPFLLAGEIADLFFSDFLSASVQNQTQPLEELFKPVHRLSKQLENSPPTPQNTN